jgi:hypothetical protein
LNGYVPAKKWVIVATIAHPQSRDFKRYIGSYMYDSMLYGNGLSLWALGEIDGVTSSPLKRYLYVDNYIYDIAFAEPHKRILKDFQKLFTINDTIIENHILARRTIQDNIDNINSFGFERWVSKNMLINDDTVYRIQDYLYVLYNSWFNLARISHQKYRK